jgi:hypothetical protein
MKIEFSFDTQYGKFADALWFSDEEPIPPEDQIEIMKQQRLNDWLAIFTAPSFDAVYEISEDVIPEEAASAVTAE